MHPYARPPRACQCCLSCLCGVVNAASRALCARQAKMQTDRLPAPARQAKMQTDRLPTAATCKAIASREAPMFGEGTQVPLQLSAPLFLVSFALRRV